MKQIVVTAFGGVENFQLHTAQDPHPKADEVVIKIICIGMNQADLMARRGEYRLSSGEPPFTPGIEGGGVITEVGTAVKDRHVGQRVILSLGAPQGKDEQKGTYRSHFVALASETLLAPDGIDDALIGALWLPFVTAWGALVWRQNVQAGQVVLLPAASSSVAIAASQIIKQRGGITIGTTTSPNKVEALKNSPAAHYDHIVVTGQASNESLPWWKIVKNLVKKETTRRGVDVIFDPVAAGDFLHHEIRLLAQGGTLWAYGLLGSIGHVDISPLIRKDAAIRGWLLNHIVGTPAEAKAYQHILENVAAGIYQMPIAGIFTLEQIQKAHTEMENARHIGKYILKP